MRTLAYAKLNLTLDVLFRRADGYHELDMLNVRVSLADTMAFTPANGITVTYEGIKTPPGDTVTKAVSIYSTLAGRELGANIHVVKHIPAEAGLGGGSADAAEALLQLQLAYGALTDNQLHEAARMVGADVPYCLYKQPCRVGGIGEKIELLAPLKKPLWFLLLKPQAGMSTPLLFSQLALPAPHPDTGEAIRALYSGDMRALGGAFYNALQPAAVSLLPEIGELCRRLQLAGAYGVAMTGSGSAVFALFEDESGAKSAASLFSDIPFRCVCSAITESAGSGRSNRI